MKSILIYSGKGGVGKTTTTANLAKTLSAQGKKVFILDADINTPSMHIVFPDKNQEKNMEVYSMGYETDGMIYIQGSMIKSYIKEAKKGIKKFKPDYVLIDTPPSITDVHLNLLDSLELSGVVFVTQPSALSMADVSRTASFFNMKKIPVIGIVENMSRGTKMEYSAKLLGRIKFSKDFDYDTVYKKSKAAYKKIAKNFTKTKDAIFETAKKQYTDESLTKHDIKMMIAEKKMQTPKFINLATWDYVLRIFDERWSGAASSICKVRDDKFLEHNTTEKIARMLEAFDEGNEAQFMIVNAPDTAIPLITGEIGQASLVLDNPSHYGVPSVQYITKDGSVRLFPHEIIPMGLEELNLHLKEGYILTTDNRYLPNKETVEEIFNCYGSRVGVLPDWKETYDKIIN